MTPPPAWPYSALKPLVSTVNSVSASTRGRVERGFGRVAGAVGADAVAVERGVPRRPPARRRCESLWPEPRASGTTATRLNGLRMAPPTTSGSSSTSLFCTCVETLALSVCTVAAAADHFHLFGNLAELKLRVEAHGGGRGDDHVLLHEPLEARRGDLDPVDAGQQVGGIVLARAGGDSLQHGVGVALDNRELRPGHGCARRIRDNAGDVPALALCINQEASRRRDRQPSVRCALEKTLPDSEWYIRSEELAQPAAFRPLFRMKHDNRSRFVTLRPFVCAPLFTGRRKRRKMKLELDV